MASLGNIQENPHIGIIFIDFSQAPSVSTLMGVHGFSPMKNC
jgi:hypothetical protein